MAVIRLLIFLLFFFINKNTFSQRLDVSLAVGGLLSNMKNDMGQGNIINHQNKRGYNIKIVGVIQVNKRFNAGLSVGYIKLGDSRLINAGYSQNNTEIFGTYQPWSIVKYKDYVKLNYYSVSLTGSYNINDKIELGINFNNLFISSNKLKRNVFVSNFEATYAETIWYKNKTSGVKKYNFAPEVFINLRAGKKTIVQISYLNSLISVFENRKIYHQSLILGLAYKI